MRAHKVILLIIVFVIGYGFLLAGCGNSHKSSRDSGSASGGTPGTGGTGGGTGTTGGNSGTGGAGTGGTGTGGGTGGGGGTGTGTSGDYAQQAADQYGGDKSLYTDGRDVNSSWTWFDASPGEGGWIQALFSTQTMFTYINWFRQTYSTHGRHYGPPFDDWPEETGWKITMTLDDTLAGEAQAEAERLAAGGSPQGKRHAFQNGGKEYMWLIGLDTTNYQLSAVSDHTVPPVSTNPLAPRPDRWHRNGNGTMRQAVGYQDYYDGAGSRSKLGVGRAVTPDNLDIWWVLIFGGG